MFSNYSDGLSSLAYQISKALRIKAYCFQISTNDTHDAMNAFSYIEKGKKEERGGKKNRPCAAFRGWIEIVLLNFLVDIVAAGAPYP